MTEHSSPEADLFDLEYILAEIEELRVISQRRRLGTLDYLLQLAEIEARHQARLQREASSDVQQNERWRPPQN